MPVERDGDAWEGAALDVVGVDVEEAPPGAGVVTLQAVSPARQATAATARMFFKILLPVCALPEALRSPSTLRTVAGRCTLGRWVVLPWKGPTGRNPRSRFCVWINV